MKILIIGKKQIERLPSGDEPSPNPNAKEYQQYIELGWKCDVCKDVASSLIQSKGAYSELDIIKAAQAGFHIAFFECGCVDEKSKNTTAT